MLFSPVTIPRLLHDGVAEIVEEKSRNLTLYQIFLKLGYLRLVKSLI